MCWMCEEEFMKSPKHQLKPMGSERHPGLQRNTQAQLDAYVARVHADAKRWHEQNPTMPNPYYGAIQ